MRGKPINAKHLILPDEKYQSSLVAKFINMIMQSGKKNTARNIFYKCLDQIASKTNQDALKVFETALENASPQIEVRSKRIGGATYQVPMEVRPNRKISLAMRWIINAAREKQGKPFKMFLSDEIIDAYNNTGTAIKKKEEVHKMAEANKAFAHFARF